MAMRRGDTEFRHPAVSYLDYKQIDMDRVLTSFFARLAHHGAPAQLARATDLTVDDYVELLLSDPERFDGFDRQTTYRWVETHLLDVVNRGKATQAVAGPRPLHGYAYRLRNARRSRPYGADEQLYQMIFHASGDRGRDTLAYLSSFFFAGADGPTSQPTGAVDVETQALASLVKIIEKNRVRERSVTGGGGSYPPLLDGSADLLADDVLRLLFHREHIPRTVLVDYLKILFAFHLALYHLRVMKALPALVAGRPVPADASLFLDVAGVPATPAARLAERSAAVWFGRIPDFIRATFTVSKLDEFATYLERRGKLRAAPHGTRPVTELLRILAPTHRVERTGFATGHLAALLKRAEDGGKQDAGIGQILRLGLDDFTTYVEVVTAYRIDHHRKYLTECLDSLLLKNRPGAMVAQPRRGQRRFVLDGRLLEILVQIALLRPGGERRFHTGALRMDEFLAVLRERYGLYIDELPPGDGFARPGISDQVALRDNTAAFATRLREIGFYVDLSDAYLTRTITPRYVVSADGSTR